MKNLLSLMNAKTVTHAADFRGNSAPALEVKEVTFSDFSIGIHTVCGKVLVFSKDDTFEFSGLKSAAWVGDICLFW